MTRVPMKVTVPGGGVLRGDAAASYLRMLAAGMPVGGVAVYSRTMAKQAELRRRYLEGKGPLAARPNKHAPHIKGVALDLTTTARDGSYRPSEAHRWLTAGGKGSLRPQRGEKLRAHAYGWRRTVPSERWHFGYDPARDTKRVADLKQRLAKLGYPDLKAFQRAHGIKPDGVDGPVTWTALLTRAKPVNGRAGQPKPKQSRPEPPVMADGFALGVANCQSYDGDTSDAAWRGRAKLIAAQAWSVVAVCETTAAGRTLMLAELARVTGHEWKTITAKGRTVAVLFDATVWAWRPWRSELFPGSKFGHGIVTAPLVHRDSGRRINVASLHVRPKSIATGAQKDADIARAAKVADGSCACVLAGDFARDRPKLAAWTRATPRIDTMDAAGEQTVDAVYVKGGVGAGRVTVVDPGALSDHTWLGLRLAIPATSL